MGWRVPGRWAPRGAVGAAGGNSVDASHRLDGNLTVKAELELNHFALLAAPGITGDSSLTLASEPNADWAKAGRSVLLWRTTGVAAQGGERSRSLATDAAGRYLRVRISSRQGQVLKLAEALPFDLPLPSADAGGDAALVQLVEIPEYGTVTVPTGSSLTATAWNGRFGGIVSFMADELQLDGSITMDGRGGRGGGAAKAGAMNCAELNGVADDGYAGKGEGLEPSHFASIWLTPAGGPLNYLKGGGGGSCSESGGGGGGHFGGGGAGAHEYWAEGDGRGLGGAALSYEPLRQLLWGAGGGGAHGNALLGSAGGAGGGVVLLWTRNLTGSGVISANGAAAEDPAFLAENEAGSGGGGSGGAVVVQAVGELSCVRATAKGGQGGTSATATGPAKNGSGGGGGGGVVKLTAKSLHCTTDVSGGPPGAISPDALPDWLPKAGAPGKSL